MDMLAFIITFLVGVAAAFVGSTSGGTGLISVSALLLMGLPPQASIATSRLATIGLTASATYKYVSSKKINFRLSLPLLILLSIGSFIGANILININEALLSKTISIFFLLMLPLVFFKKYGLKKVKVKKLKKIIGILLYLPLGIYVGFFGGGWGILSMYIMVSFFGLTFVEGSATNIFIGLFSTIVSLFVYLQAGIVNFEFGIPLLGGMLIGGYLGAHTAIKKGNNFVRFLFIIVVLATAVKLLFF